METDPQQRRGEDRDLPDVPLEEAPPGRALHELTREHQEVALAALDGLAQQLRAKARTYRAGTAGYHRIGHTIGHVVTAAAALRRHLATLENG